MKLFKSLLAAQAVLGLLAPMTAGASEINLIEMNNYARNKSSSKSSLKTANSLSSLDFELIPIEDETEVLRKVKDKRLINENNDMTIKTSTSV